LLLAGLSKRVILVVGADWSRASTSQRLIAEALQAEFDEFLSQFAARRDDCVFRRNVTEVSDG